MLDTLHERKTSKGETRLVVRWTLLVALAGACIRGSSMAAVM